jgi:hypothetical protein
MSVRFSKRPAAVAALALCALPAHAQTSLPQFDFTAPSIGGALSGNVQGPPHCVVEGQNIARVMFYLNDQWTNTDGNLSNGLGCWIDTTRYRDGTYTLKAVAYNSAGQSVTRTREIRIQNTAAPASPAGSAPTVSFTAPAAGGTLSGNVQGPDSSTPCVVQGTNIARVMFYLNDKWTNTDGNLANGLGCWIDTTKYANGTYTLKAVAYNAAGESATATRQVQIQNGASPAPTAASLPSSGVSAIATFESLGLYWRPESSPGAAGCQVRYRAGGESAWKPAMALWYDARNGECRGSLVHLRPGTSYEVQLGLPGQSFSRAIVAKTWSEQLPIARTVHVSSRSTTLNITEGGTASGYVLYTPAPGTQATIDVANGADHNVRISAPYVIVRGFTLRGARTDAVRMYPGAHDVVVENNDISNWGRSRGGSLGVDYDSGVRAVCSSSWRTQRIVVQNNRIHDPRYGSNSWSSGHPEGPQAISFQECGGNHVFRYNAIYSSTGKYFNDAIGGGNNFSSIGFPNADTDVYGNRISQAYDDGIEAEGANRNVRVWGNYIDDTYIAIASTATHAGPFYVFRNVYNRGGTFGKSGERDGYGGGRRYFLHNTLLQNGAGPSAGIKGNTGQPMTNSISRNNVWHMRSAGNMAIGVIGGSLNDFDYDLSNGNMTPYAGAERSGQAGTPVYAEGSGNGMSGMYQLSPASRGYDDGVRLPNFNDDFTGNAPDMGAHEAGKPGMRFGVR